ncbi:MAG: succinate dehydrogenase cytochrome b subunit [Nitrospirae bacterium]|nr:MAG: succinate dehydrogenase cytochrome b subunit [Nitrospirota bacterium]
MRFLESPVGRKLVMTVSGLSMIGFVIIHLLGNTSLYYGADSINAYAKALHGLPPLLWGFRLVMLIMVSLHVFYGISLTLENRGAKTGKYAVRENVRSTFAGRSMIWTGLFIGAFIIYHLLHFTFQVIDPGTAASGHADALGRPDVFMMVVLNFRRLAVSSLYVCAMAALGLHLLHSLQSAFQTMGLSSDRTLPVIVRAGALAALLISLGYAAFPLSVLAGIIR